MEMSNKVQQGVILAAGRGKRIHPLTHLYPKPLQPVCNKPIMQYQMEIMREAGIDEIAVVIGSNGNPIKEYFGHGHSFGLKIDYIEDPEPEGIASSLARAESWVRGPFAVFLGDIFLVCTDFTQALIPLENGAVGTILVRRDRPEMVRRNFAVIADSDGQVERVIEKPSDPSTDLKGCGVYVFAPSIFDAIRRTPRSTLRNEYELTEALQLFIEMGEPVFAVEVVRWDVNISYPDDLLACNLKVLREMNLDSLIGQGARIGSQTQIKSSIIGDRAIVDSPVVLEECLVLPDTQVVDREGTMRRHIFGDSLVLPVNLPEDS
jgi:dTDP-glucose pyrophosphorylase